MTQPLRWLIALGSTWALCATAWSAEAPPRHPAPAPAVQPRRYPGDDLEETRGRRDQYEDLPLAEVLDSPLRFYDRRIHVRGIVWAAYHPFGGWSPELQLFGQGGGAALHGIRDELGVLLIPGYWPRGREPDFRQWTTPGETYALLDPLPTLSHASEGADRPVMQVVVGQPLLQGREMELSARWQQLFPGSVRDEFGIRSDTMARVEEYRLQLDPSRARAEEVATLYEQALHEAASEQKELWFRLGWVRQHYTGDLAAAFRAYQHVYTEYGRATSLNGAARYHAALCLEQLGRRDEARALYRELVRQHPNNFWTTDAASRLRALGDGEVHFDLNPGERELMREALRRCNAGDAAGELRLLRRLYPADQRDPWIRLHAGLAAWQLGRESEAAVHLQRLGRLQPGLTETAGLLLSYISLPVSDDRLPELPRIASGKRLNEKLLGGLGRQMELVLIRDRTRAFPEDVLPALVRALHWSGNRWLERAGVDGPASLQAAIQRAPASLLVRLHTYSLTLAQIGMPPVPGIPGSPAVQARRAEELLELDEPGFWGLHEPLAHLYSPEGLNEPARAAFHQRRYAEFKQRFAKG